MTRSAPSITSPDVPSPLHPFTRSLAESASACVIRFFETSRESSESSLVNAEESTDWDGSCRVSGTLACSAVT